MTRFAPSDADTPSEAAPEPPRSVLLDAEPPFGTASLMAAAPLSGSPELAERPERKRRRRAEKNPAGQGIAAQHAFPEARFPVWARSFASQNSEGRIDASRRSERRRAADEHFEGSRTEDPVDRRSPDQSSAEGLPERRGFARWKPEQPMWLEGEEGREAEEVLDRGPLGGRAMDEPPEGRGSPRRTDAEGEIEPALEPVSGDGQNLAAPVTGRPFEGRVLRGFGDGNTSDAVAEERGQAEEGRGLDIGREALSATDGRIPPRDALEAAFLAGAALAALDSIVRAEAPWRGAWSARLALSAAAASARLLGRGEDEAALRDAFALRRPGDDPGPAGRLLVAWRRAAGVRPERVFAQEIAEKIALDLGLPRSGPVLTAIEDAAALATSEKPAVFAAAEAAAQAYRALGQSHGREAEILALLLADAVLTYRLGWPVVVPLFATVVFDPALRRGPEGKRPRPDDPDWPQTCCLGFARAAAGAHDLARDLARRAEKLEAAVPGLRTKGIEGAVAKILSDDVVAAPMRPGHLSERSARRLLDRLVALGALRELTGRPSFRLYGL